jgi:hypothetical protein
VDKIESRRSIVTSLLYGGDSELCERDKSSYTTIQLLIIVLLIVLFPLSVVIHSIVIIGIVRTTIVKDNCSDALTITNNYNTISNTSRTNNRTNNSTSIKINVIV